MALGEATCIHPSQLSSETVTRPAPHLEVDAGIFQELDGVVGVHILAAKGARRARRSDRILLTVPWWFAVDDGVAMAVCRGGDFLYR